MTADSVRFATVASDDGTAIAYDARGDGPPLVLVGGALSTRLSHAPLADALARRFTAITFDRRGRGDSGFDGAYSVESEIDDLATVIDEFGGACAVYGHSSGGVLALRAAVAGVGITHLAIYEPPLFDPSDPRVSAMIRIVRGLLAEGRRSDAVECFLRDGTEMPPELLDRMKASDAWSTLEALAHTLDYDLTVTGTDGIDPMPALGAITTPALVLDGGLSSAGFRTIAAAVADELANAQHGTIADQRHNASVDALAPVLVGFFTTNDL